MDHSLLLLTSDGSLAGTIRDLGGVDVVPCLDVESFRREFEHNSRRLMVFDQRAEYLDPALGAMAQVLTERAPVDVHLVTYGERAYPVSLSAFLEFASSGHVEQPSTDAKTAKAKAVLEDAMQQRSGRTIPSRRVMEAGELRLFTYTEAMFPVIDQLQRVAPRDVTLLLVGETGTGKTTLAQIIHHLSPRQEGPFQNVACGALPRDLIESELFGHVRGAFTSADRYKIGRFEAAGVGTLLLDEIDVLGPKEQAKLLRVIETGEYELVGGTDTQRSRARLVVASNVELEKLVERESFRSDLYYRLNVLQFRLPPLRERPLDIVPLASRFAAECAEEHDVEVRRIHPEYLRALQSYHWPGNIRELVNQVQRSVLFCEDGTLTVNDLCPTLIQQTWQPTNGTPIAEPDVQSTLAARVAQSEQRMLEEALRQNDWSRTRTARALGISRVGLYKKMRKHGMIPKKK